MTIDKQKGTRTKWHKVTAPAMRASIARPGVARETFAQVVSGANSNSLMDLIPAALFHGIIGYVWKAAREVHDIVPPALTKQLELLYRNALMRHFQVLADVKHLHKILNTAGIPWLIVKGPVLAEGVHDHPALRTYSDLDVLVPPQYLDDALIALESNDCTILDRNWTLIHSEMKGEVHLTLPAGSVADLHWSLLNDRANRESFSIDSNGLFDRSIDIKIGGLTVHTLNDVDTVVYLALHTMLSGGHRLIWLKDIERLLEARSPNATEVTQRAREWGADIVLRSALQRTQLAIGLPAGFVLEKHRGVGAKLWLGFGHAVWRMVPAEREDGQESLGRAVARSGRPSAIGSLGTLLRKFGSNILQPAAESRRFPGGTLKLDPSDPRSHQYDSGGPEAKTAFLAEVDRQA